MRAFVAIFIPFDGHRTNLLEPRLPELFAEFDADDLSILRVLLRICSQPWSDRPMAAPWPPSGRSAVFQAALGCSKPLPSRAARIAQVAILPPAVLFGARIAPLGAE